MSGGSGPTDASLLAATTVAKPDSEEKGTTSINLLPTDSASRETGPARDGLPAGATPDSGGAGLTSSSLLPTNAAVSGGSGTDASLLVTASPDNGENGANLLPTANANQGARDGLLAGNAGVTPNSGGKRAKAVRTRKRKCQAQPTAPSVHKNGVDPHLTIRKVSVLFVQCHNFLCCSFFVTV